MGSSQTQQCRIMDVKLEFINPIIKTMGNSQMQQSRKINQKLKFINRNPTIQTRDNRQMQESRKINIKSIFINRNLTNKTMDSRRMLECRIMGLIIYQTQHSDPNERQQVYAAMPSYGPHVKTSRVGDQQGTRRFVQTGVQNSVWPFFYEPRSMGMGVYRSDQAIHQMGSINAYYPINKPIANCYCPYPLRAKNKLCYHGITCFPTTSTTELTTTESTTSETTSLTTTTRKIDTTTSRKTTKTSVKTEKTTTGPTVKTSTAPTFQSIATTESR
uniref:Uncharacterized protein n=1 Tax=Anopheles minimus TaxID=112268 RepID=A0A182VY25_9DIPT